jgi:hypothetical protein
MDDINLYQLSSDVGEDDGAEVRHDHAVQGGSSSSGTE